MHVVVILETGKVFLYIIYLFLWLLSDTQPSHNRDVIGPLIGLMLLSNTQHIYMYMHIVH